MGTELKVLTKRRINIDLDGVLADFVGGICNMYMLDKNQIIEHWTPGCWDVFSQTPVDKNHFWQNHTHKFWAELERLPNIQTLFNICEEYASEIIILTSPGNRHHPQTYTGKLEWLQKHVPDYEFVLTPHKHLLAHDSILIDDNEENCKKFYNDGGFPILYPRIWNRDYQKSYDVGSDPFPGIRATIEQICSMRCTN